MIDAYCCSRYSTTLTLYAVFRNGVIAIILGESLVDISHVSRVPAPGMAEVVKVAAVLLLVRVLARVPLERVLARVLLVRVLVRLLLLLRVLARVQVDVHPRGAARRLPRPRPVQAA